MGLRASLPDPVWKQSNGIWLHVETQGPTDQGCEPRARLPAGVGRGVGTGPATRHPDASWDHQAALGESGQRSCFKMTSCEQKGWDRKKGLPTPLSPPYPPPKPTQPLHPPPPAPA